MSATRRFKRWLVDKVTKQTETERPPSETQGSLERLPKTIEPSGMPIAPTSSYRRSRGYSVYEVTADIAHIVFHKTHILMGRGDGPHTQKLKRKDYILKKDPVTRKTQKLDKKDIGERSRVFYYDGRGELISE